MVITSLVLEVFNKKLLHNVNDLHHGQNEKENMCRSPILVKMYIYC